MPGSGRGDGIPNDATMRKLPLAEIVVGALALLAGVGVYVWAHSDQGALEESKQLGATIVAALQAHRAATGTYPPELADLVPDYLPRLEQPTWGLEEWRYRRYTPAEVKSEALAPAPAAGDAAVAPAAGGAGSMAGSAAAPPGGASRVDGRQPDTSGGDPVYFQLSVAANASGYPVLYYDYTARRWVLNN